MKRANTTALVMFCVTMVFFWAAMYSYVPILPVYARNLGASLGLVGVLVGSYGFTQMVLRIPIGLVSDRTGRRKPFLLMGVFAAGAGAMGLALSPTPELLVLFRGVVGVGAATWVASSVLFSSYFGGNDTTRAMGLLNFTSGVAQLIATAAGGWVADEFGWRTPFFVGVGLAAIGFACAIGLPESARPARPAANGGSLLRVVGTPLLLAVAIIAALGQYSAWATTYAFIPVYASQFGATGTDLGLLTFAAMVPYTLTTLVVAALAGRVGERKVIVLGLALMAVGSVAPIFAPSLVALAATQVLSGIGRALSFPVLMGLSIRDTPPGERATAMGFFQATYAAGMFIGPSTAGLIADSLSIPGAFAVSGALCLLGSALALALIPAATLTLRSSSSR